MKIKDLVDALAPELSDLDGVRELLDQFGEDAVKLEANLNRLGAHRTSDRIVSIAVALKMAYLQGQAAGTTGKTDRGG